MKPCMSMYVRMNIMLSLFIGCWADALRDLIRSVYSYFGYNPDGCFRSYHDDKPHPHSVIGGDNSGLGVGEYPVVPTSDNEPSDDEDEEIDVVNEPSSADINPLHPISSSLTRGGINPSLLSFDSYMALRYPSNRSHDTQERSHDTEEDTQSMSSTTDDVEDAPPTVNYFGYEMARGESLQSSPLSNGSGHSSQHDTVYDSSSSPKPHPSITSQSPLLVCPPHVYSHLYPQVPVPFLLQPNLLMKMNPLLFPTTSSVDTPTITKSNSPPLVKSPLAMPPYALTRPLNATPTLTSSLPNYQPLSSSTSTIVNSNSKDTPTIVKTPPSISTQQESKNKRGRNQGIYIYTTPTEPLKFMSLSNNSGTSKSPSATGTSSAISKTELKKFTYNTKKMVAMAPVAPPTRTNGGITTESKKLLKDSDSYYTMQTQQTTPPLPATTQTSNNIDHIRQKQSMVTNTQNKTPATSLASDVKTRRTQGNMKRKRELVFHWYHSPEQTLPLPPSKRINTTGTV